MTYRNIGNSVNKIDAPSLITGMARFTDDFEVEKPLFTATLYSSMAHAEILDIDTSQAEKIQGVVDILHYRNVPRVLHTTAGQGYPEPSPYDTLLFDKRVRFVGDRVALVAAESEEIACEAVQEIKVKYKPLEAIFDIEKAMNKEAPRLHVEDEHAKIPVVYRPKKNLAAEIKINIGDCETGFQEAEFIEDHTYKTQINAHCTLEPHCVQAFFDEKGRLVIISTTQVPFHARRIVGTVLDIPLRMIRVIKPRIGGGFGCKQEVFLEPLVALVAWRNKRPVKIRLSRKEVFVSSRTRHGSKIRLKTGVKNDGKITTLEMDGLLNAGAYGPHALTVLSNVGLKVLPLFNKIENLSFQGRSVYTNLPIGGAFRGYGATQGYFAFNQQIDMIARAAGWDIIEYCKKWHIREGEGAEIFKYLGEGTEKVEQTMGACELDECIDRGATAIQWYKKRGKRIQVAKNRIKGMGMAIAMQGSGIPKVDMGSASMKMNEDGSFNLYVGATDLGTGSDTILAQIAAEVLKVKVEKIIVLSSDTDHTPFDTGAYASSTTYISGGAVKKCAQRIKNQIIKRAALMLDSDKKGLIHKEGKIINKKSGREVTYREVMLDTLYARDQYQIQAQASHIASISPPPFTAQFAEVDVDTETGKVNIVKFVSVVDCGRPINPKLAEGQVEGAVVQGLSYTLTEDYIFNSQGKMVNAGFWNYKIYTAEDIPEIETIIVDNYEPTGPFGAKSVAEIAINGPAPAIANAIYDAVGIRIYELPITPEKLWRKMKEVNIK